MTSYVIVTIGNVNAGFLAAASARGEDGFGVFPDLLGRFEDLVERPLAVVFASVGRVLIGRPWGDSDRYGSDPGRSSRCSGSSRASTTASSRRRSTCGRVPGTSESSQSRPRWSGCRSAARNSGSSGPCSGRRGIRRARALRGAARAFRPGPGRQRIVSCHVFKGYTMKWLRRQPPPPHVLRLSRSSLRSSGRCSRRASARPPLRSAGLIASSGRMPTPGLTSKGTFAISRSSLGEGQRRGRARLTVEPKDGCSGADQPPHRWPRPGRPFPETDEYGDGPGNRTRATSWSTGSTSGTRNVSSSSGIDALARPEWLPVPRLRPFLVCACRPDRAQHETVRPGRARASSTARRLIDSSSPAWPNRASRHRLAPKVLVSTASGAGRDVTVVDRGDLIRVAQAPERRVVALEVEPGRDEPRTHGRVQHQGGLFDLGRGSGHAAQLPLATAACRG